MKFQIHKIWLLLVIAGLTLTLTACGFYNSYNAPSPGMGTYSNNGNGNYASNGERSYFTATDDQGQRIPYTGGTSYGGMMMGSYLTCASCHGSDGRGGVHYMHMQTMDAPPISYDALVQMMVEESGGTSQPDGYILDDFRRSVVDGQHPDGDRLERDMPRWQMSDDDLADLFEFLKTLP